MEGVFLENAANKAWKMMNYVANGGTIYQNLFNKKGVKELIHYSDKQICRESYDDVKLIFSMIESKIKQQLNQTLHFTIEKMKNSKLLRT